MRVNQKQLIARMQLLSNLTGIPMGLNRMNPGDGATYCVEAADGSRQYSPRLKAGELNVWLGGAIWAAEAKAGHIIAR